MGSKEPSFDLVASKCVSDSCDCCDDQHFSFFSHLTAKAVFLCHGSKLSCMQSTCMSLACIACTSPSVNQEAHNAISPCNILIKWACPDCSTNSFCSLLVSELLHMAILVISPRGVPPNKNAKIRKSNMSLFEFQIPRLD